VKLFLLCCGVFKCNRVVMLCRFRNGSGYLPDGLLQEGHEGLAASAVDGSGVIEGRHL